MDRSTGAVAVALASIGPEDWRRWRALRLAALAEAPEAFGSTLAEWSRAGDVESRWRDRLGGVALNLVASRSGVDVGMVSATAPLASEVELISMWVAPEARGQGVGDALVDAVVGWAVAQGVSRVALSVRNGNEAAIALYRRHGFVDDGPSDADPDRERRLVRAAAPPPPEVP